MLSYLHLCVMSLTIPCAVRSRWQLLARPAWAGYWGSSWSQSCGVCAPRSVTNGVVKVSRISSWRCHSFGERLWTLQTPSPEWQLQKGTGISAFGSSHWSQTVRHKAASATPATGSPSCLPLEWECCGIKTFQLMWSSSASKMSEGSWTSS